MPFIAVCPFCNEGKVKVPDGAVGHRATCPRCGQRFTLTRSLATPETPAPPTKSGARSTRATPAPPSGARHRPTDVVRAPKNAGDPSAAAPPRFRGETADENEASAEEKPAAERSEPMAGDPPFLAALVAIVVGGIGLLASQITDAGRYVALALAAVGILVGLGSTVLRLAKPLVPAFAALFNTVILLVLIGWPGLLGLPPWRMIEVPLDTKTVHVVTRDGTVADGDAGEWVDAARGLWQQGDIRVAIRNASIGLVELVGPGEKRKPSKVPGLQLTVHVTNAGVMRKVDFKPWDAGALAPRLTDSSGKTLAPRRFESGWEPAAEPIPPALFPGKSIDQLFVFEPPRAEATHLRLELPAAAFGGTDAVRLRIPRSLVTGWPEPEHKDTKTRKGSPK